MTFKRVIENFTCEHCGASVIGTGYTNHCPNCLWSKHVDLSPGDRAASCHGLLMPQSAIYKHESYVINYRCQRCAQKSTNKSAPSDNSEILIKLVSRPSHNTQK